MSTRPRFEEAIVHLRVLLGAGYGDDGVRDPASPCAKFERYEPANDARKLVEGCAGDGHHYCDECRFQTQMPF